MVHNGIEYGDMQLIAEAYAALKLTLGYDAERLAETFAAWNAGDLESFLVEITAKIFTVKDQETGSPLVELILDKAGQKGTGRWTAQVALELAVPVPTMAAAIDARVLSSMKDERLAATGALAGPTQQPSVGDPAAFENAVRDALYASKICSYAQGMHLIAAASAEYGWGVDLREMARIWKAGCIIRARFLDAIMKAYEREPAPRNLMLDPEFARRLNETHPAWRMAVAGAQSRGIPVPALSASLAYFDSYRSAWLPANLVQAQRDFFGSHTYERADHPERGFVHTDWVEITGE
jgi:6-phosphogluconate dehydrogenase